MGAGRFEFLHRIDARARVPGVLLKGVPGPVGQGVEFSIILSFRAHVVPEFPPGDELIEETFRALTHPPPTLPLACRLVSQAAWGPSFMPGEPVEHFVGRDVAEVKVCGQSAGRLAVRVVSLLCVPLEPLPQKPPQDSSGLHGATPDGGRRDPVIDRKGPKRYGFPSKQILVCRGPFPCDLLGKCRR